MPHILLRADTLIYALPPLIYYFDDIDYLFHLYCHYFRLSLFDSRYALCDYTPLFSDAAYATLITL